MPPTTTHAKLPVKAAHSGTDAGWTSVYLPGSPLWTNALCVGPAVAPQNRVLLRPGFPTGAAVFLLATA